MKSWTWAKTFLVKKKEYIFHRGVEMGRVRSATCGVDNPLALLVRDEY
jgi:hypothetical protein